MTPGEVYPIEIPLPPTSNLFKAGHRIRLDISSSNFPRFDLNPNTGEPVGRHTEVRTARNTVYLDADRPSHVILPIIPSSLKRRHVELERRRTGRDDRPIVIPSGVRNERSRRVSAGGIPSRDPSIPLASSLQSG